MKIKTKNKKEIHYACKECGLKYKEKEWRDKCQVWCEKHKSCNLEIIKHTIQDNKE